MSPAAAASSCAATRGFAPTPPPSTLRPIMRIWEDRRCAMRALPVAPPSHAVASSACSRGGRLVSPALVAALLRRGTHWRRP
eukprot:6185386-Pleurochrysis_carterae.AAC.1